jgi:peptide deformylase
MVLPIYLYGQAVLRKAAEEVPQGYAGLKQQVADMYETMYHAEGIGLAAPQVGLSIRLLVIDANIVSDDYPECKGFKRTMVNPVITERSDETASIEEGCLSFPGLHEKVTRALRIRVKYMDEHFTAHDETFEGYTARIVQHECDHLEGNVFIDNISAIRRQLSKGKLNNIIRGTVRCAYRVKRAGK